MRTSWTAVSPVLRSLTRRAAHHPHANSLSMHRLGHRGPRFAIPSKWLELSPRCGGSTLDWRKPESRPRFITSEAHTFGCRGSKAGTRVSLGRRSGGTGLWVGFAENRRTGADRPQRTDWPTPNSLPTLVESREGSHGPARPSQDKGPINPKSETAMTIPRPWRSHGPVRWSVSARGTRGSDGRAWLWAVKPGAIRPEWRSIQRLPRGSGS